MNSPLNFGFIPGNMQNLQNLGIDGFGDSIANYVSQSVGSRNPRQLAQQIATGQLANQGIASLARSIMNQGPQVGTAAQIAASGVNNQDPNNASATGFSSIGGEMYADPSAREATGAPRADLTGQGYATNRFGGFAGPTGGGTITAGMAMGNAPIATVGGFNPAATATANGIYGSEIARANAVGPKKLITL